MQDVIDIWTLSHRYFKQSNTNQKNESITCPTAGSSPGREHVIQMDVRIERGGDDAGPTPPECLAMASGGCVMNIIRVIARESRIRLDNINLAICGDIDPSKALGLGGDARAGFSVLSIVMELTPGLSVNDREQLQQELARRCPLCDTVSNPTPLKITFR